MSDRVSPLGGRRPTRDELQLFANDKSLQDVLGPGLRLLIVGINPGLWTAAVNAPFARPGNRFWPSLHEGGITEHRIDASAGLSPADVDHLISRGVGVTNLVARATVRADELSAEELREGAENLIKRVQELRPEAVVIAGITAFRVAFARPKAQIGLQPPNIFDDTALWVLPQPSGLNAHATVASLAAQWAEVWESLNEHPVSSDGK